MKIGLSILTHAGQSIWENGIGQNIYFLARLLDSLEFVERVLLVDCGDQRRAAPEADGFSERFPIVSQGDASDLVDVAIEIGGGFDLEWIARFRARGGKVCFYVCGQPYAALIEPSTFNKSGFFSSAERCDEVWVLPKDAEFTGLLRALHRCPVYVVPYLWASDFLDQARHEMETASGPEYGYVPGSLTTSTPARIAIFESNSSPIKTGLIPLLACEMAQLFDDQAISEVHLLNSSHFAEHTSFTFMKASLDIGKTDRIRTHAREYFAPFMATNADIVISHQLHCSQNYLYFDVLAGGYPLIHNSPLFEDVGYYYPDCDVECAAAQVIAARLSHDRNFNEYRMRGQRAIDRVDPLNPHNRTEYARRLIALHAGQQGMRT